MQFIVSDLLPMPPTPGEEARRIVRHGMSDILEWLGEPVGPAPATMTHLLLVDGDALVSQQLRDAIVLPFRGLASTVKAFGSSFLGHVGPLLDPPRSAFTLAADNTP